MLASLFEERNGEWNSKCWKEKKVRPYIHLALKFKLFQTSSRLSCVVCRCVCSVSVQLIKMKEIQFHFLHCGPILIPIMDELAHLERDSSFHFLSFLRITRMTRTTIGKVGDQTGSQLGLGSFIGGCGTASSLGPLSKEDYVRLPCSAEAKKQY